MKLRTQVLLPDYPISITYNDKILSLGSCFADNMGRRMNDHLLNIFNNPFGIVYHPIPIGRGLRRLLRNELYTKDELIEHQQLFHSWDHHGSFSTDSIEKSLELINHAFENARQQLMEAKVLIITFGTAWGYFHIAERKTVANCHKFPAKYFKKSLMILDETIANWFELTKEIFEKNPRLQIILSVSPVRHLRDGIHENQRSKAELILAVDKLCESFENMHYFPAYEIMMDELRDYRFYEADLVHPNALARDYIWEKFCEAFFDAKTQEQLQSIAKLRQAAAHHPFHPQLRAHQQFLNKQLDRLEQLRRQLPHLRWDDLEQQFRAQLIK